jgi:hypothetical protein
MATQPFAFEVCSSSPWGTDDYHAELFDQGDTDHQLTSFAPTWIANPTITEERTHELEPDEKIWSREYAAIPGATVSQALDREDATHCFVSSIAIPERSGAFCAMTRASFETTSSSPYSVGQGPVEWPSTASAHGIRPSCATSSYPTSASKSRHGVTSAKSTRSSAMTSNRWG